MYLITLFSEGVGGLLSFQCAQCGVQLAFPHHLCRLFLPLAHALEFFLILVRDPGCLFLASPNTQEFILYKMQPLQDLGDGVVCRPAGTGGVHGAGTRGVR